MIERVRILLEKDVNSYWSEYMEVYKEIYGSKWVGCKCKSGRLREVIQDYYNKNKN